MGSAASPPPASGSPGRCVFFIAKKKRRCGMLAKPGATLCGNHARDGDDGARVECEHCKTRVANLAKHLRRCPARLHKVEQASQPYFALDVNTGEDDPEDPRAHTSDATLHRRARPCPAATSSADSRAARWTRVAPRASRPTRPRPNPSPHHPASSPCASRRRRARALRRAAAASSPRSTDDTPNNTPASCRTWSPRGLAGGPGDSPDCVSTSRGDTAGPVYVELGAGRGYLAHFLLDAYGPADLLMVERKSYRFKAERGIGAAAAAREAEAAERAARSRESAANRASDSGDDKPSGHVVSAEERAVLDRRAGSSASRLRVDIKDLRLSGAAAVSGRDVVVLGKHLCGAATDLALRCLLETEPEPGFDAAGVAIATCCHHRCEWRSYVNRGFFRRMGFDGDDFAKLAKLSSWACLDHGHGEGEHAGSREDANETRDVGVGRDATRVGAKRAKTNETNAETERGDRERRRGRNRRRDDQGGKNQTRSDDQIARGPGTTGVSAIARNGRTRRGVRRADDVAGESSAGGARLEDVQTVTVTVRNARARDAIRGERSEAARRG